MAGLSPAMTGRFSGLPDTVPSSGGDHVPKAPPAPFSPADRARRKTAVRFPPHAAISVGINRVPSACPAATRTEPIALLQQGRWAEPTGARTSQRGHGMTAGVTAETRTGTALPGSPGRVWARSFRGWPLRGRLATQHAPAQPTRCMAQVPGTPPPQPQPPAPAIPERPGPTIPTPPGPGPDIPPSPGPETPSPGPGPGPDIPPLNPPGPEMPPPVA